MPKEEYKFLPRKLECIDKGHPFTAEVWKRCISSRATTRPSFLLSQRARWTT
jgi:hypothetical protein